MKTMTIREVPDELHAALKERARRHRRSLNQQVIAELSGMKGSVETDDAERKARRAEELIRMVDGIRSQARGFMSAREIDAAIEEGRA